jgi:DNA-binding transcriptional MerR regulator
MANKVISMPQQDTSIVQADIAWLSITEFSEISGLTPEQVQELVDLGVLAPSGTAAADWLFNHQTMTLARRMRRLRDDLDLTLDLQALALGFRLLERISELESELARQRAQQLRVL